MPDRSYSRLAWSLFALAALFLVLGLLLRSLETGSFCLSALIGGPVAVVGALVASGRPLNPIGWLFLAFGVVAAFAAFASRYSAYALIAHPGSLPGGDWAAWVASGIWHPAF